MRARASVLAITHVRIIDGTGRPAAEDQTIVLDDGRIRAVGPAGQVAIPSTAEVLDRNGFTAIPGLVGMHEHLFYELETASGSAITPAQASFSRLYLAGGVTTMRTAGTVDFEGDRKIKEAIDAGDAVGPAIHLTGPYLGASTADPDPDGVARVVDAQAEQGATSFKAYTSLRRSELRAAVDAAHRRGLRITGHVCAVGYRDAAALGIDNLEHGLVLDTEFYSGKQPDVCPNQLAVFREMVNMDLNDTAIQQMMFELRSRGVAVTSTLTVLESYTGRSIVFDPRVPLLLASRLRGLYDDAKQRRSDPDSADARLWLAVLKLEMEFERRFVALGGRLMAGADPTGWGGVLAGLADQRELELLVEAGLTAEEAVKVATLNGAEYLQEADTIGTIEVGKQADLVLIRGNPAADISAVRNVKLVFRKGIGYDAHELIAATCGTVGRYDVWRILPWSVAFLVLLGALIWRVVARRRRLGLT
ncbi:MAG TPA: amidohydrolase family protein [Vicinamibacterales bacterium]|jgi:imidazolonepropionase-like amidohydrolase|nr:amidohydrolase family protein [Vicinamibacterales bacterium]